MIPKHSSLIGTGLTPCHFAQRSKFKARECRLARRTDSTPQQARHEAQRRSWTFCEVARARGFTLIEIMVVIVILGILAMYVAPKLMGRPDEAKQVRAKMDIAAMETALKLYKLDSGIYPGTEQGLLALVQRPESGVIPKKWRQGGYLEKGKVPKDPWGNDYIYLSPGLKGEFDVISYGADGVPGGENENKDINNWDVD
jgi:general secretion pathway protein G